MPQEKAARPHLMNSGRKPLSGMTRVTFRLIFSLVLVASGVASLAAYRQTEQIRAQLQQELIMRATILAESLQASLEPTITQEKLNQVLRFVERVGAQEHFLGVAVYAKNGVSLIRNPDFPRSFQTVPDVVPQSIEHDQARQMFIGEARHQQHLYALPIHTDHQVAAALLLVHDASYIEARCAQLWREHAVRLGLDILLIVLATLLIIRWSVVRPLAKTIEWMRRTRAGSILSHRELPRGDWIPLVREVNHLVKNLLEARSAAEEEAKLRLAGQARWTAERLKEQTRTVLQGRVFLVISNREPYLHVRSEQQVRCVVPPSGLVTAVEPILRACGGTWIAHGSGNADRDMSDANGRLRVPPDAPAYTLKRVWLTEEEEQGHYYGFSNEGIWPLCHIAHTRPVFRREDWAFYQRVNAKFADAALQELEGTQEPYVLIQDYHFALLPRLLKDKRPDAKIALFWHIPWPNPEAFGICPWAGELLHGMLGADLLGFHLQFHCNNFLDTVDRTLESRIDWEQFAVNRADHTTWVKPFPISIATNGESGEAHDVAPFVNPKDHVMKLLNIHVQWLGVGVDRIDYTKGIAERFRAIERFLERHASFQGKFTFVQLGAPSRTLIPQYQQLERELDGEVERINQRFQTRTWRPIVFLKKQHSHADILPFYRAADVCLVTSLHDGMNLVAKEFVAARTDARGALILSKFAGASRELQDALLVNPYDSDQVAEALYQALTMDMQEQRTRMSQMREVLQEHNVYRWAANLITGLAQLRSSDAQLSDQQAPRRHESASLVA